MPADIPCSVKDRTVNGMGLTVEAELVGRIVEVKFSVAEAASKRNHWVATPGERIVIVASCEQDVLFLDDKRAESRSKLGKYLGDDSVIR